MKPRFLVMLLFALAALDAVAQCPSLLQPRSDRTKVFKAAQRATFRMDSLLATQCRTAIADVFSRWQRSDANTNVYGVTFVDCASNPSECTGGSTLTVGINPNPPAGVPYLPPGYSNWAGTFDPDDAPDGFNSAAFYLNPTFVCNGLPLEQCAGNVNCNRVAQTLAHELGHAFGLDDCYDRNSGQNCDPSKTSMALVDPMYSRTGPTTCDNADIRQQWEGIISPDCVDPGAPECSDPAGPDPDTYDQSPILLDLGGEGIRLTSPEEGVFFDIDGDGAPERLSWTEDGDDAWLALDRNGNGRIDDGTELFGNFTAQPPSGEPNGYLALRLFDDDGNDAIDAHDPVWPRLRLWRDANHDGVSQSHELIPLDALQIDAFELSYREAGRRDRHGNWFRYRARVHDRGSAGRWSYDVFLRRATP